MSSPVSSLCDCARRRDVALIFQQAHRGVLWRAAHSFVIKLHISVFMLSASESDEFWGSMLQMLRTYLEPSDRRSWNSAARQQENTQNTVNPQVMCGHAHFSRTPPHNTSCVLYIWKCSPRFCSICITWTDHFKECRHASAGCCAVTGRRGLYSCIECIGAWIYKIENLILIQLPSSFCISCHLFLLFKGKIWKKKWEA